MSNIDQIKKIIKDREKVFKSDEYLIFKPPDKKTLYTSENLKKLLSVLINTQIPSGLSLVQKSHWVKRKCIDILGYLPPKTLRSKEARANKPKFIHQLLDIFVQSSNNLQVWNYIPYLETVIPKEWNEDGARYKYSDCRYVIVSHTSGGVITRIIVKTGKELKDWDSTSTKTIKWQANVLKKYRDKIRLRCVSANKDPAFVRLGNPKLTISEKIIRIQKNDHGTIPLIKKPYDKTTLFSSKEIKSLVQKLIGMEFKIPQTGQERVIGQTVEKLIVRSLGYRQAEQTDTGGYPDLLNQLLEVKFQYSGTIDLGKNLPNSDEIIKAKWNKFGIKFSDIRYLICLVDIKNKKYQIGSIVITSGKEFNNYFSMCEGQNFKVQMIIPSKKS